MSRLVLATARALALLAALSLSPLSPALAQQSRTGWEFAGVPALNYDADEGVGYGVSLELYNYGSGGLRPYLFTLQPTVFLTTGGRRDFSVFFDSPHLLPEGWRVDASAGSERQTAAPFYGVGNETHYDPAEEAGANPRYYRFGRTRSHLAANLQRTIPGTPLRALVGASAAHVSVVPVPEGVGTTLVAETREAAETRGGWSNSVRLGVVWDTRDRETGPRRGVWSDLLVQRVDGALGSSHEYTRVTLTDRRYLPLASSLTLAQRTLVQTVAGDAPFYDLFVVESSYKRQEGLGGAKTLRGLPKNRYAGKSLALSNTELRWRAARFQGFGKRFELGVNGFVDAGRVWAEEVEPGELAEGLHWGMGGGVRLGMGENFVVAVDVGHSEQAAAPLYIGLGYLF